MEGWRRWGPAPRNGDPATEEHGRVPEWVGRIGDRTPQRSGKWDQDPQRSGNWDQDCVRAAAMAPMCSWSVPQHPPKTVIPGSIDRSAR